MTTSKRHTIQQQLVYDAVKSLNIHATAEQVYEYVARKHPSISKATVYRNLSKMAEAGRLLNIGTFYGATHYDHNVHDHGHCICKVCRRIFDVEYSLAGVDEKICDAIGFEISNFRLSFDGLCSGCKHKEAV